MSYDGSGTFNINTAGQPVVDGTVISATVFNALTSDLGTGLTTALTKDGQTTPTANIPMGTFKITGLGAGTVATDAVRLSQLQSGGSIFITAAGTDTITATASPALTAYATGNLFTFVVAVTNTGAVTLNIDGLGAKAITRDGTTALAANDLVATEVVIVVYDGTQFQVVNPNAATNYRVSGTLGVTGAATLSSTLGVTGAATLSSTLGVTGVSTFAAGSAAAPALTTTGDTNTGIFFPAADTIAFSEGGAEAMRIDTSGVLRVGTTTNIFPFASNEKLSVKNTSNGAASTFEATDVTGGYPILYLRSTDAAASQTAVYFYRTNTVTGSISTTASSTAYNTSSDYRLKEDWQPMSGSVDRVKALNPVNFAWKLDGSRVDGFLAHEVQEVVPEAIAGAKDATKEEEYEVTPAVLDDDGNVVTEAVMGTRTVPDYQGIDQSKLVPLLTAALQEALTAIESLTARVSALEGNTP